MLAADLVAEDRLSDSQIAAEVDVHRQTLAAWKRRPEFQEKVRECAAAIERVILTDSIARRSRRVRALDDRWLLMQQVIEERAASSDMRAVPGGKTGLLAHDVKSIGGGGNAERVDVYEVDTGLLKELREHEKQAAQELGQWVDKMAHGGDSEAPPIRLAVEAKTAAYARFFGLLTGSGEDEAGPADSNGPPEPLHPAGANGEAGGLPHDP